MQSFRHIVQALITALFLALVTPASLPAGEINDAEALAGLKVGKGVFLIDIGDPQKLAFYLDVIKGTHAGLVRQRATPDLVLVFIGPSVRFLTTEPSAEIALEHDETLKRIATTVKDLAGLGVRLEICAVATKAFHIDNTSVLPQLKLINDGFISLIGYQAQGYSLVPVY